MATALGREEADGDELLSSCAGLRYDLAAGLQLLHRAGQSDLAAGFFSGCCPARPPASLVQAAPVRPEQVCRLLPRGPVSRGLARQVPPGPGRPHSPPGSFGVFSNATGERVAGEGPMPNFPSFTLSSAIYSRFPQINAIIHAHGPNSMAVASSAGPSGHLLPMSEHSFMFYDRVAYLGCNFFFDPDYVAQIVEQLGQGKFAVLMRNHSFIMVGRSVQECYLRAHMFEQSCKVQLKVLASGAQPHIPAREECLFHRRSYEGYDGCPPYDGELEWPGLLRQLDRDDPNWHRSLHHSKL